MKGFMILSCLLLYTSYFDVSQKFSNFFALPSGTHLADKIKITLNMESYAFSFSSIEEVVAKGPADLCRHLRIKIRIRQENVTHSNNVSPDILNGQRLPNFKVNLIYPNK